jgi:hypothetical protein
MELKWILSGVWKFMVNSTGYGIGANGILV